MEKKAVILAGGRGTRLYPYTVSLPKPLVPVADTPILEIIIRQLQAADYSEIILAVNHQAELVRAYFGDGEKYGIKISYSLETSPLSTIAPLRLIPSLPENFLVMNGDVLTDLDFSEFFDWHKDQGSEFSISTFAIEEKSQFGVLELSSVGQLVKFSEKPVQNICVSMGIYMANRSILRLVPESAAFGFDDLMRVGLCAGAKIVGRAHKGYWRDLGTPEQYQQANAEIMKTELSNFLCRNAS